MCCSSPFLWVNGSPLKSGRGEDGKEVGEEGWDAMEPSTNVSSPVASLTQGYTLGPFFVAYQNLTGRGC